MGRSRRRRDRCVHPAPGHRLAGQPLGGRQRGAKGWSATGSGRRLDGMELDTDAWHIEPGRIVSARSSFFEDQERFPPGTATLDSVLVMRQVPVRWLPLPGRAAGERRLTA
ncbi:hypothetical protein ACFQ69_18155 [Streptomyces sp. NPDC056470]|uniref:hypothetical protein n=1 Tax=Streptomyces sp. NPDC056470 TaxID=3345831 RepID=UPI00367713FD